MRTNRVVPLFVIAITTFLGALTLSLEGQTAVREAPTGFDDKTNGMIDQARFDAVREIFDEREETDEGLGPVYNALGCGECHQNPVVGGISQIAELRAGRRNSRGDFEEAPGGSLIHDRAIHPDIQERVGGADDIRTLRVTTTVLGAGFVEAIDDATLIDIARAQPGQSGGVIAGQVVRVPVLEAKGVLAVGRFGWKNQHASLVSFSADAYLNEMGVTSDLLPNENSSMGRSVADHDDVPDPEDGGNADVLQFAEFMRATKAPPRDEMVAASPNARAGSQLFDQIGCNICHVRRITTAPLGTKVNGGAFRVPAALANKIIRPFSDYLLHDIDTGDGIVQNGGQSTANKLRTMPLWGTRTRSRHMHDGMSLTFTDSILRHGGEARNVTSRFRALSSGQRNQIVTFLQSL